MPRYQIFVTFYLNIVLQKGLTPYNEQFKLL